MNVFELSTYLGTIAGAVAGGAYGHALLGGLGIALGVPAGAVLGWFAPPAAFLLLVFIALVLKDGPKSAIKSMQKPQSPAVAAPNGSK